MTHLSIRIVVFSIVSYLLLYANSAPFGDRSTFDIFNNPVDDFLYSLSTTTKRTETTTESSDVGITTGGTMIIVPMNFEGEEVCKRNNTEMDINGLCRQVWH